MVLDLPAPLPPRLSKAFRQRVAPEEITALVLVVSGKAALVATNRSLYVLEEKWWGRTQVRRWPWREVEGLVLAGDQLQVAGSGVDLQLKVEPTQKLTVQHAWTQLENYAQRKAAAQDFPSGVGRE